MKINQFKSDIINRGVLRNHSFEAEISLTRQHYLRSIGYSNMENINIRCDSAQLPGVSLASVDGQPKYGYGPIESYAYSVLFDPANLTFTVDAKSDVYKFFYDWLGCIVNFNNTAGLDAAIYYGPSNEYFTYEVGYKSKYSVDLRVKVFNEAGKLVKTVTMYKAYPKAINQIDLSYENTGSVMKLMVPFAYRDFSIEFEKNI